MPPVPPPVRPQAVVQVKDETGEAEEKAQVPPAKRGRPKRKEDAKSLEKRQRILMEKRLNQSCRFWWFYGASDNPGVGDDSYWEDITRF